MLDLIPSLFAGASIFTFGVALGMAIEERKKAEVRKVNRALGKMNILIGELRMGVEQLGLDLNTLKTPVSVPSEESVPVIPVTPKSVLERDLEYDRRIRELKEELKLTETSVNPPNFFDYDEKEHEANQPEIITDEYEVGIERRAKLRV